MKVKELVGALAEEAFTYKGQVLLSLKTNYANSTAYL